MSAVPNMCPLRGYDDRFRGAIAPLTCRYVSTPPVPSVGFEL